MYATSALEDCRALAADDAVPISPVPEMQALDRQCLAGRAQDLTRQANGN
jgi:hypothetical protein